MRQPCTEPEDLKTRWVGAQASKDGSGFMLTRRGIFWASWPAHKLHLSPTPYVSQRALLHPSSMSCSIPDMPSLHPKKRNGEERTQAIRCTHQGLSDASSSRRRSRKILCSWRSCGRKQTLCRARWGRPEQSSQCRRSSRPSLMHLLLAPG